MVDTLEKISHSGKRISPETKTRVILFFPECGLRIFYNEIRLITKRILNPNNVFITQNWHDITKKIAEQTNRLKHTVFSWGCYGRHAGKNITLWKKNITRDEDEGDIVFSRVWSSTITPSTKGSMFLLYWILVFVSGDILFPECDIFSSVSTITPSTKDSMFIIDFEFLLESVNQSTHYVHITT
jgi:hypothetical protein